MKIQCRKERLLALMDRKTAHHRQGESPTSNPRLDRSMWRNQRLQEAEICGTRLLNAFESDPGLQTQP